MTIVIRENGQEWRLSDTHDGPLFDKEMELMANSTGQPVNECIAAIRRSEQLSSVHGRTWRLE